MKISDKKIVIGAGLRTPIGHQAKSLSPFLPEHLMGQAINGIIEKTKLDPHAVDGVLVGWVGQGSHAPNIARVSVLNAGLPVKAHAFTIQANCVSSLEAISAAYRHIITNEGQLYLAGGTESMSTFPYAIRGPRGHKMLRSLEAVQKNWAELPSAEDVLITDTTEEGLNDPIKKINMAATAEICAQMFDVSREEQDQYAAETFKRCLNAEKDGFYDSHTVPVVKDGQVILKRDEYPFLRENLVAKPKMFSKAPPLFGGSQYTIKDFYRDNEQHMNGKKYEEGAQATVTLFNACARSDGAAVIIVTSEEHAKALGLEILAEVASWGFVGNNPAHMGISPVYATQVALERAGIKFEDVDAVELHEAFAATCLSIFKVAQKDYKQDWRRLWEAGKLNPHGGSIPLGHPLAATGVRLILNLAYQMKRDPSIRHGLATACASGGLGGAMILRRYEG